MYYPKSQIKPNLFTNGGEYVLSTTKEEYKGYYYETSTEQLYTGKNPSEPQSILLEPLIITNVPELTQNLPGDSNPIVIPLAPSTQTSTLPDGTTLTIESPVNSGLYNNYPKRNEFKNRLLPQFNLTIPTSQDQQNGQFTRYFCKRNNEPKYLEISQTTFNQLYIKSTEIAWDLYTPVSILWQIKGDKNKVYVSNKALTESIETKFKWYGFSQYFQGKFLKYYVES
jgi:hypothetical protein